MPICFRALTAAVVIATQLTARPTGTVAKMDYHWESLKAERDNLIQGAILGDQAARYSVVTANDLGIASQTPFAVLNGGVDPLNSDCLCLRPGNLALQGRGSLSLSEGKSGPSANAVVLAGNEAAADEPASGFGIGRAAGLGDAATTEPEDGSVARKVLLALADERESLLSPETTEDPKSDQLPGNEGAPALRNGGGQSSAMFRMAWEAPAPGRSFTAFSRQIEVAKIGRPVTAELRAIEAEGIMRIAGETSVLVLEPPQPRALLPLEGHGNGYVGPSFARVSLETERAPGRAGQPTLLENTIRFYQASAAARSNLYSDTQASAASPESGASREERSSEVLTFVSAPRRDIVAEDAAVDSAGTATKDDSLSAESRRFAELVESLLNDSPTSQAPNPPRDEEAVAIEALSNGADLGITSAAAGQVEDNTGVRISVAATLAAVPEPGTVALTFVGAALIFLARFDRRRRRQQ